MTQQRLESPKGTTSLPTPKGRWYLLFLLFFLALTPRVFAWEIERYENNAVVHEDGITTITETLHVNFGEEQHHGIYRSIPVESQDVLGQRVKTRLQVRQVTDENGRPWHYKLTLTSWYIVIRIGDADRTLSGKKTYKIVYDVERGAIRFFKDHDEFFWNLIGTEWEVPIGQNENHIEVPQAASGVKAVAYQGAYGSTTRVQDLQVHGNEITVSSGGPLGPREGLTVAVRWNKGLIPEPSVSQKLLWWLQDNGIYAVPVLVFFFMLWLWNQKGRDPKTGHSITVTYAPPDGMTPAEISGLLNEKAGMTEITATVIDLAVKGFIKIEALEKKILGDRDYQFTSLKAWDNPNVKPHEKALLDGIFDKTGDTVKLSDLKNVFYSKISGITNKIYGGLVGQRLLDSNPDSVRAGYIGFGFVFGVLFFFGVRTVISEYALFTGPLLMAAVLSSLIIMVFGYWMPRRTMKGADLTDQITGFSEFLKRVDADKIKRINDPTLFERCLPFAMVFGFADQWAHAFEGLATQPPTWYVGYGYGPVFSPRAFSRDMGHMTSSMGQTFASVPSSSSSGFGGGGFSGGGGGGGGGGAW